MNNTLDLFTEADINKLIAYIKENRIKGLPLVFYVDLFCGAGGMSTGLINSHQNAFVVACINHDATAILSHHKNHPYCIHYTEDIRDWDLIRKVDALIGTLRLHFPEASVVLHASLECTHFSKAKGGQARDADSRTLADHLFKYLTIDPDYITIENVEEFLSWGPLDENMKPIKERKAEFYNRWVTEFEELGFVYNYKMLNAADYGEYTSRNRYFGIFAKGDLPLKFPKPTHSKTGKDGLKKHKPVREVLDLEDHGRSVFGLTKQGKKYSPKTVDRCYYGFIKYKDEKHYTMRYNGGNTDDKCSSLEKPIGTLLTSNTHAIVTPLFLSTYYGGSVNGQGVYPLDDSAKTIGTKDTLAIHHVQYAYGNPFYSKIDDSLSSITTVPKAELVTWLFDTQFGRIGCSINKPSPTVIARQDKKPLYMATVQHRVFPPFIDQSIPQEGDSFEVARLREALREAGAVDLKIRTLHVHELKRIQGFPENYILEGGKTKAMKYIGNSVCPAVAKAIGETLYDCIVEFKNVA